MSRFLLVCAGGAAGSAARYAVTLWSASAWGSAFPYGTLIVNLAGSFLIALVMHLSLETGWIPPDMRLLLTTGVLGGFTTYSSFNYETTQQLRNGPLALAFANIAATLLGCLLAGFAGLFVAKMVLRFY